MPLSSQETIDTCRRDYVTRLLNQNPLLRFSPGAERIDALTLFNDIRPNTPVALGERRAPAPAVSDLGRLIEVLAKGDRCRIVGLSAAIYTKCEKIRLRAVDLQRMSGQQALYIGYPLLYSSVAGKVPTLAPVFLIPVAVTPTDRSSIGFSGGTVQVNPLLGEWCRIYKDVVLAPSFNGEWALNDTEEGNAGFDWNKSTRSLFGAWRGIEGLADIDGKDFEAAPTTALLKQWQGEDMPCRVLCSAVFGIAKFNGQALLDDLTELAKKREADIGTLAKLVRPRQSETELPADRLTDASRRDVVETDVAQERSIAQAQQSPWMVVQGPPGTGKSQTIVNLIAQALDKGSSVAVFCAKRAALEVVKKRLAAKSLGHLCQLIDDVGSQRARIIKEIKAIDEDFEAPRLASAGADHTRVSRNVAELEQSVDEKMRAFYKTETPAHDRYADIRSRMLRLAPQHGLSEHGMLVLRDRLDRSRLDQSFEEETGDFLQVVERWRATASDCGFDLSPWRSLDVTLEIAFDLVGHNLSAIREHWESLLPVPPKELNWLNGAPFNQLWGGTFLAADSRMARQRLVAAQKALIDLTRLTRLGPRTTNDIVDALYGKQPVPFLKTAWLETLGQAGNVHGLGKEMIENSIGEVLLMQFGNHSQHWPKVVEAAILENMLARLNTEHRSVYAGVGTVKGQITQLGKLLSEHLEASKRLIQLRFASRVAPMQQLRDRELLRERGNSASGTRKTELRDLFGNRGLTETQRLFPVLLSTPEVGCALLPLKARLFDLVIIDEASQMFTAEALPLIFRAKQVVVAGDSKQMPPSDYFSVTTDNDDYDEETDTNLDEMESSERPQPTLIPALDGESLLEAAEAVLGAKSPALSMLQVHYRSEFAELIEFSNQAFYEGKLMAPPGNPSAQAALPTPISYHEIHGAFSKGINRTEAEEIVRFVTEFWKHNEGQSMGIIVLNVRQRDEISRLLQERAGEDEAFGQRLETERGRTADGEDVGFFVRSVEHVQGDERDTIILGATYAGNSRRFGPIAEANTGRRRLNVAITRARKAMVVFCSLNVANMASDADKNSDRWYFQQYLRYAEFVSDRKGPRVNALLEILNPKLRVARQSAMFDSAFEEDVAEFLAQQGFETEPQKPDSEFRIDLAVKRSDGIGYICGIECDGAKYHSTWKARTRDVWRQKILESKGWRIERLWSTDWFQDQPNTKKKLIEKIRGWQEQQENATPRFQFVPRTSTSPVAPTSNLSEHVSAAQTPIANALEKSQVPASKPAPPDLKAQIGDTVCFQYSDELVPRHVRIVPRNQPPDRANGIIWPGDPLGRKLLDCVVGENFEIRLPTGVREGRLLSVQS